MFKMENIKPEVGSRILHGTTTVAIKFKDGVVLAADKRATAGYYIAHKKVRKIAKIDDKAALTISGLVADAQMLADIVKAEIEYYKLTANKDLTIKSMASILSNVIFSRARILPYIVQLIVAGYDSEPRIYTLDWFGTVTEEKYVATGSGSPIAISIIETSYRDDLSLHEALAIAVKAVNAAMKRDVASGEGIDVVAVTKEGYREFSKEEIEKIISNMGKKGL